MTVVSRIVLDTGPLGKISHPRPNREIANWLERVLRDGAIAYIPEIADYEVRRELIRAGLQERVNRLDRLKAVLNYLPINTEVMLKAAELWAQARKRGTPTADPKALDADVGNRRKDCRLPRKSGQLRVGSFLPACLRGSGGVTVENMEIVADKGGQSGRIAFERFN